ncbi:class I SAM-dependent methyltransferase [Planctomycetes bacterium K23_9]|uniref:Tellurite methyltransferase n=1 Tax=Stieleria marina TaxID=1930275 RepID=A0A517P0Z7_9BACT|nr:Tellurite methyltransferase [Planctomycetes bacterium K23_9]
MSESTDLFHEAYDRDDIAYGDRPSAALSAYLQQAQCTGSALDLGAGAGRDTIALAKAGYDVTSVDLSERGLERIRQRAEANHVLDKLQTQLADVRDLVLEPNSYSAIVATTVLDHIPAEDAAAVWLNITNALTDQGMLYVEVHATEDPGSGIEPGLSTDAPVSETANAVINYFAPNQLASWATAEKSRLRILRYEERLEWDYTHGPEHLHGKAILLAVRAGHHFQWHGQPIAFPRKS